jgi:hypothetical protein
VWAEVRRVLERPGCYVAMMDADQDPVTPKELLLIGNPLDELTPEQLIDSESRSRDYVALLRTMSPEMFERVRESLEVMGQNYGDNNADQGSLLQQFEDRADDMLDELRYRHLVARRDRPTG